MHVQATRTHEMPKVLFFGAPFQSIQKWLVTIHFVDRRFQFVRQHEHLTSRTATRVYYNIKAVLRQRPQNIQSKAVVSWTELVHIGEEEVNRARSCHPVLKSAIIALWFLRLRSVAATDGSPWTKGSGRYFLGPLCFGGREIAVERISIRFVQRDFSSLSPRSWRKIPVSH